MAYVLGFIFADGSLDVNPRGSVYLSIQITDEQLLKSIRATLGSDHTIATRLRVKKTEKTQYRLQIGGKEFCKHLIKLGVTSRKSKTMLFPKVPHLYVGDFVRGYFDGDGNVWSGLIHKDREKKSKVLQTAFTSGSLFFLESLRDLLFGRIQTKGSLYIPKAHNYFRLIFSTQDSLKIYKIMYNGVTELFLERKKRVFEEYMRP